MKKRSRQPAALLLAAVALLGIITAAKVMPTTASAATAQAPTAAQVAARRADQARRHQAQARFQAELRKERKARERAAEKARFDRFIFAVKAQGWAKAVAAHQAEVAAQQKAAAAAAAARARQATRPGVSASSAGNGRCGGNLPPCCVMMRESRGDIHAQNAHSSASGKWQFVNGTWNNYDGYPTAASAPESVQDAKAAQVWAGGAGRSAWGGGC